MKLKKYILYIVENTSFKCPAYKNCTYYWTTKKKFKFKKLQIEYIY